MKITTNYTQQVGEHAAHRLLDKVWLNNVYPKRSTREIARDLGCGKKAVLTALRRHGIEVAKSGVNRSHSLKASAYRNFASQVPKKAVGKLDSKEWMSKHYIARNLTSKNLSAMLGVTKECVQKWARRHGLKKSKEAKIAAIARGYRDSTGHEIGSDWACRKRMGGHSRRNYRSPKAGTIVCHSSWEEVVAKFLDESDAVISYSKDCLRIPYEFDGKQKCYYPDFLVTLCCGNLLIEVKAHKLVEEPRTKAKLEALSNYAESMRFDWMILTGWNKVNLQPLNEYLGRL